MEWEWRRRRRHNSKVIDYDGKTFLSLRRQLYAKYY